jgi:RNA recognition motif-containing protein
MDVMLYVGNLARSISENELRNLFSQVGEVTTIRIIKDRISGESQEYGFVSMSSQSEADHAVSRFNKYPLSEQRLRVGLVRPRGRTSGPAPRIAP